ncbi:hypothetical protein B0H11DRAFT_1858985 [Mycena galericulata]|nr:hypothetical protein B0H11DRAFT_1858985 [Mycena galericulata]
MVSPLPETDPRLPPELEHAIFEISALSRPIAIPNLMLVAQRVKIWVEPILYQIVFLSEVEAQLVEGFPAFTFETFLQAIDRKPPEFFKYAVRHLFLGSSPYSYGEEVRMLDSILTACTGNTNLFAWTGFAENLSALNALDSLHHLTVNIVNLFGWNPTGCFAQPLFYNITHLEVLVFPREHLPGAAASLSLIPHLTHFAFGDPRFCGGLCDVLHSCARLACIVLLLVDPMNSDDMEAAGPFLEDALFVVISQENFKEDWARGVLWGRDYWALADAFLTARRTGKVDRSQYYIYDDDESWFEMA